MAKKKNNGNYPHIEKREELIKQVGRIKYLIEKGLESPLMITKRMRKRLEEYKINIDDIKPIKVIIEEPKEKKEKKTYEDRKRVYEYYRNGEYVFTGTQDEIYEELGIPKSIISQIASLNRPRMIGQGKRHSKEYHTAKYIGKVGELKDGKGGYNRPKTTS